MKNKARIKEQAAAKKPGLRVQVMPMSDAAKRAIGRGLALGLAAQYPEGADSKES